jgi:hypothetical protein
VKLSNAIANFYNAKIDYFGHMMLAHDMIRGSRDTPVSALSAWSSTDRGGASFKNHRVTPAALLLSDTFADTNLAKSMALV